ncbi:Replication factor C subunit 1 [Orchesella cincta]|uniref:Replication factor C subunit 1 n=1 Tax=Orchesella cincta TaxID=48709 RepID=A0A1D2M2F4_ORCCI|nr:Replication factor C subunit 1 [Orchesella cincta]
MKVNKPGSRSSSQRVLRSSSGAAQEKTKKDDPLNVSCENSDREDALPKKAGKGARGSGKSNLRKSVIEDDDSDESSDGEEVGRSKRKARVLSDSDEDDLRSSEGKFPVDKSAAKKQPKSNQGMHLCRPRRLDQRKPLKSKYNNKGHEQLNGLCLKMMKRTTFPRKDPQLRDQQRNKVFTIDTDDEEEDTEDEEMDTEEDEEMDSDDEEMNSDDEEEMDTKPAKKTNTKRSVKRNKLGRQDIGTPDCLKNQVFVMAGVLHSMERDECKNLIIKYGGRVTTTVSGKTNYLIVGENPGQSSLKKAKQLKTPQITEDDLLEMIRNGTAQDSGLDYTPGVIVGQMKTESDDDLDYSIFDTPPKKEEIAAKKKDLVPKKQKAVTLLKKDPPRKVKEYENVAAKVETKSALPSSSTLPAAPIVVPPAAPEELPPATPVVFSPAHELLWVEKYKPQTLDSVLGQGLSWSNSGKLVRWLQNWFIYHGTSKNKVKAAPKTGFKDAEGKTFKAALLSGPPGIGKTLIAQLAVHEVGFDALELNASNQRNKKELHETLQTHCHRKLTRKHVLIMDEVEGMFSNEDRGGLQELVELIKTSRVPLICICNERFHSKIRTLATYCFDLRFYKPSLQQLKGLVSKVCFAENIHIPQERVQQLITSSDSDARQILHQLQLFKEGKSDQAYNPQKNLKLGPFDVVRKVFVKSERDQMSIDDKAELFSQDYNLGHYTYLQMKPTAAEGRPCKHLDLIAKTAGSIADADLIESSQTPELLPIQAVFASVMPGEYMESTWMPRIQFPKWLGKDSTKNKNRRNLLSLHTHLHSHISGSLEALNMDYVPYLSRAIINPLAIGDHQTAAEVFEDYTLLRDDLDSLIDLSKWPGIREKSIESRFKAAFTRSYNQNSTARAYPQLVKGKKREGFSTLEDDQEELLEEGESVLAEEEEEEDESIEKDTNVKVFGGARLGKFL